MPRQTISLGKIFNIPIGLDYSWFLIFIMITWSLATSYFPAENKDWPAAEYWIVSGATAILFFASVLLHELGHSVVALRYKIPVRSITLFVFGGVAQIAAEPPSAVAEFWIALAGPLTSFALAALFWLLQTVVAGIAPLFVLARYLANINGTLAVFNLIPGFPLDGGRVFRAVIWGTTRSLQRATFIAASVGRLVAFLFIVFGVWQIFTSNLADGLWIAFIGWFLDNAANAQIQHQTIHDAIAGHKVLQAMNRNYTIISPDITLQRLADEHILGEGRRFFIVRDNGDILGLITLQDIKGVPRREWPVTSAGQIMIPAEKMQQIHPDGDLWEAVEKMDQDGVNQLPVIENGQVLGILSRDGVIGFLRTI